MRNFFKIHEFSKSQSAGFLVVEILVAISIVTAAILTAMSVSQKSITVSRQSVHTTQAAFLLEEGAEAVRVMRDNNWTNISGLTAGTTYYPTFTSGTWTLSTTPNSLGIFTRTITMQSVTRDNTTKDISGSGTVDPDARLFTVTVSWSEGATTVTKSLQFYIINIFS